jgi:RNA polymerase sigma factor (sigma-70 family)
VTAERAEDYGRVPADPAAGPAVPPAPADLTKLFITNYSQAHAVAMKMVWDRATAQDVVQDSFIAMYTRWNRLSALSPQQLRAYLTRVVVNRALEALRQHRGERLSGLDLDLPGGPAAGAEALALANSSSNIVVGEFAQLPRRQKEVLALTMDGYSPAEIASILGIEANAVRVHLHHARAEVRTRLKSAGVLAA